MMTDNDTDLEMRAGLNLVLYELYHLDSVKNTRFDEKGANYYLRMPIEKRLKIKNALDWALANKDQQFNEFLPNQGHIDNSEIVQFLAIIKNGFEQFGICDS